MPELPEVETVRRDLEQRIVGEPIADVEIRLPRIVSPSAAALRHALTGNRVAAVERIGKLLVFRLRRGSDVLLVHLKMTGQLVFCRDGRVIAGGHSDGAAPRCLPDRHTRAAIGFKNGSRLFFNDLRTFGYLKLASPAALAHERTKFGPDPLAPSFTFARFDQSLGRGRSPVKAALLDQHRIAGIGNIYADESLFRAGIRPQRLAASVTGPERRRLYRAIRAVLRAAVRFRGTTFNSFVDADGRTGAFVKRLTVYGRGGQPCRNCRQPLIKTKVAGRGTHWCEKCQR